MTHEETRYVGGYEVYQAFYLTTFGHLTPRGHSARAVKSVSVSGMPMLYGRA